MYHLLCSYKLKYQRCEGKSECVRNYGNWLIIPSFANIKRKRNALSLEGKFDIVNEWGKCVKSMSDIVKAFEIPKSALSGILRVSHVVANSQTKKTSFRRVRQCWCCAVRVVQGCPGPCMYIPMALACTYICTMYICTSMLIAKLCLTSTGIMPSFAQIHRHT